MRGRWFVLCLGSLWALASAAQPTSGEAATVPPASLSMEEVWLLPGLATPTPRVKLGVPTSAPDTADPAAHPAFPVTQPVPLECVIESDSAYEGVYVRLQVTDASGQLLNEAELLISLSPGLNTCTFHLDAAGLDAGDYRGDFTADYTDEDAPARYVLPIKKVSNATLNDRAAALAADLEVLAPALSGEAALPYERVRYHLAKHFLAAATACGEAGAWQTMDNHLIYVAGATETIRAGITFASLTPEHRAAVPRHDPSTLELRDGGVFSGDSPVFLAGAALGADQQDLLKHLEAMGFNFAVANLPPGSDTSAFPAFAAAAQGAGVALAVQLAPLTSAKVETALPPGWPRVEGESFIDLSLEETRQRLLSHLQQTLPMLAAQAPVLAASIGDAPRFKFQGEPIRTAFMEHIKELYPDRHDLNEAWRSHLAKFEEIEPWALKRTLTSEEDAAQTFDPMSSYQDRRPYQSDWQNFHLGLVTQYFSWLKASATAAGAQVPLMVTLDDQAFDVGETRHGVDREEVQQLMDAIALRTSLLPEDKHFAYGYPHQSALHALSRSFTPGMPLFNLHNDISLPVAAEPDRLYDYVHTAVWEGALSGMTASAIPADSKIFEHGQALQACAFAALDLNRLAPIVHAFQTAPAEVAVLFSESSKILDDGEPHLKSAIFAYEGCTFAGYHVRFITEDQVIQGALSGVRVLVVPETPSVRDDTFAKLLEYVENGGTVARVGTPIPYNERGQSRQGTLGNTGQTVLVRGMNLPTEYLHAMDAAIVMGTLPQVPRATNMSQYPIEGVKTRYVEVEGVPYLYLVNLRKEPVRCHLTGNVQQGRDLIEGRDISFPAVVAPLDPMLIRMDLTMHEVTLVAGN